LIVDKYVLSHIYGFTLYITQNKKDETKKIAFKKKWSIQANKKYFAKAIWKWTKLIPSMYENTTFVLHWNSDNIVVFCSMGFGDFSLK
jgi:hypothetical protein